MSTTTYRVTVVTGTAAWAGTDANVYITMYGNINGRKTHSGERLLDNHANNFELGKTDVFNLETRDIGELTQVRIRHDNLGVGPGWYLDRIIIHNESTDKEWVFPCNNWLAYDEDDGQIARILYAKK